MLMRAARRTKRPARVGWVVTILIAFQGLSIAASGPASAAPSCSVASGTLTLIDDGAGFDAIDVWQDTNDTVFATVGPLPGVTAPGTICGSGVALASLREIHITGGTGITAVTIWMSQTQAATPPTSPALFGGPGATWGAIDWAVDLSSNVSSFSFGPLTLTIPPMVSVINASPTDPMSVTVGDAGVDLDSDGSLDLTSVGVGTFSLATNDATGSTMSGAGSDATGAPFSGPMIVVGGPGNDVLTGGSSDDFFVGGPGKDLIDTGAGRDLVSGGPGNDQIHGGDGSDRLGGGRGNDAIDGGEGRDNCNGGPGDDVIHCEIVKDSHPSPR